MNVTTVDSTQLPAGHPVGGRPASNAAIVIAVNATNCPAAPE
jgi:hypothetical protein